MTRIACIGEAMIELAMDGSQAAVGVAGDTLNTAIYLQRCATNLDVDYVTCLGDDPFSTRIFDFIQAQNLGTEPVRTIPGTSPGLYAITTSQTGERSFTYWRSASAARQMFVDHDFSVLNGYDAIYLTGISLAILPHDVRIALADWLASNPVKLIYDSNFRPRLWENIDTARQINKAMWARADIALPSIDDEMDLFDEDATAVANRFLNLQATGALKQGKQGPMSLGEPVKQDYIAAKNVIDTTAAGDSFNAGYIGAYLTGKTQAQALLSGHDLASQVVQHRGAIMPE